MKTLTQSGRFGGIVGGEDYDLLLRALPYYIEMQERLALLAAATCGGKKGQMVLDLGCGTGMTSKALCRHLAFASIHGVDNERKMLNQYKEWEQRERAQHKNRHLTVIPISNDAWTFLTRAKSGYYDAVVSGFMLHNLPDESREPIIAEIHRVLRPNGRFVNCDKIAVNSEPHHEQALMEQLATFCRVYNKRGQVRYGIEWIEHYIRDNKPDLKWTEEDVVRAIQLAGFKNSPRFVERHGLDVVCVVDKEI